MPQKPTHYPVKTAQKPRKRPQIPPKTRHLVSNSKEISHFRALDAAKAKACDIINEYRMKKGLKQKELARILGIDEPRMSDIVHKKIKDHTLDRLFAHVATLYRNVWIKITT